MEMLGKSPKQGDPRKEGLAGVRVGGSQDRLWDLLAWAQEDPSWQRTDSGSMEKANAALRQMDPTRNLLVLQSRCLLPVTHGAAWLCLAQGRWEPQYLEHQPHPPVS